MADYYDYDPQYIPLARPSDQLGVFRMTYSRNDDPSSWQMESLPNIYCISITYREGAEAPVAMFRYSFDPNKFPQEFPSRFHQVYQPGSYGPGVVRMDDRLCVVRYFGDGDWEYLFDGFVTQPQASIEGSSEGVTITAMGTPVREWDFVLPGAIWQDENVTDESRYHETESPARFNPQGRPNAAPEDCDMGGQEYFVDDGEACPLFVGVRQNDKIQLPNVPAVDIRYWTLGMALRYVVLVGIEWPLGMGGEKLRKYPYVQVADMPLWDEGFKAIVAKTEGQPINLDDEDTYEKIDIVCPDVEVGGECWPTAAQKLLKPYNFQMRWELARGDDDAPEWWATFYRVDDTRLITDMRLQEPGYDYEPAKTNVGAVHLARDSVSIANEFDLDSEPTEFEATFMLSPAFKVRETDADDENLAQWKGEHVDKDLRDYYRVFVLDEAGEGKWDFESDSTVIKPPPLDDLFYITTQDEEKKKKFPKVLIRRRKPEGFLHSIPPGTMPYRAKLHVCRYPDYKGVVPGLWDPVKGNPLTVKWKEITSTEWSLLPDRIGFRLNCEDPNNWNGGAPKDDEDFDKDPFANGGLINLVEWLAKPTDEYPEPLFALTCVISSDFGINYIARRRESSMTGYRIRRRLDHRDRWKRHMVTKYSMVAQDVHGVEILKNGYFDIRDDTDRAKDAVDAFQRAHECGTHAGTVTIPRVTTAYYVGQTVEVILGRDVYLKINAGSKKGETELFPRIASLTFSLDGRQETQITLTDERMEPITRRVAMQARQR